MAIVMNGACRDVDKGTCENPQFPSWAWRFNRNQFMTHYDPWIASRDEQKPPNYRNMGMHRDFRFHPMGPADGPRPLFQMGVHYCQDLVTDRQAGFGNAALGRTPGPAPPRMFTYQHPQDDELYKVNEVHHISPGMSLNGYHPLLPHASDGSHPLNSSHYLELTLGQIAEVPGTFPHFNKPLSIGAFRPPRECRTSQSTPCHLATSRNPLTIWHERFATQQARHALDRCCQASQARPGMSSSVNGDDIMFPNIRPCSTKCNKPRRY